MHGLHTHAKLHSKLVRRDLQLAAGKQAMTAAERRLTSCGLQMLPEKEARVITAQVCSGLAYLNNTPRRIIHMVCCPVTVRYSTEGCQVLSFRVLKGVKCWR